MRKISRSDYFTGVFLSTILRTAKTIPLLCDTKTTGKCVVFDTDIGDFNVYIKYSTTPQGDKRKYWNINFSPVEHSFLVEEFEEQGKQNLVAIICTNPKLTESKIAILTIDEAKECMKRKTHNGQRRITVSRTGNEHYFDCFGVGSSHDKTNIHPYVNHMRFFDDVIDDNQDD